MFLTDPGLAAALRRADVEALLLPEVAQGPDGPIIEGFVLAELLRQSAVAADPPFLHHYRDRDGIEIDLVVEVPRRSDRRRRRAALRRPRHCAG